MFRLTTMYLIAAAVLASQVDLYSQTSTGKTSKKQSTTETEKKEPSKAKKTKATSSKEKSPPKKKTASQATATGGKSTSAKATSTKTSSTKTAAKAVTPKKGKATTDSRSSGQETLLTTPQGETKKVKTSSAQPGKKEQEAAMSEPDEAVGKTKDGRTVFAGPRGGHYYLNERGDKTYVDDFEGAKVVGTTADGRKIYEGPRGGYYYYTANGYKTYVPRDK